jgi:hypothetical protein
VAHLKYSSVTIFVFFNDACSSEDYVASEDKKVIHREGCRTKRSWPMSVTVSVFALGKFLDMNQST